MDEFAATGLFRDQVFAQVGYGSYVPKHMHFVEMLTQDKFDKHLTECRAVVSHAGMGTIIRCIEIGRPLLVMPRRKAFAEHVNDHQLPSAKRFEQRGDILVANDELELAPRLIDLCDFMPPARNSNANQVAEHIQGFLRLWER